jgi:NADPH:quinone reductase-like Zn-dependent oxidoreductase
MMKAVRFHDYGGSEVLVYEDAPRPSPKEGEVLVRVRAASMNPVDWKMRAGYLQQWVPLPLPITPGRDFAGDIVELGPGVSNFQVGDAVFGNTSMENGSHAEYVIIAAGQLAHKPATIDYEAAAATPLAALSAWQGLVDHMQVQAGQRVLIHAAAGGVGHFAVQFAHVLGAYVIATASPANIDLVRQLGADEVVDYRATRFEDAAHDMDAVLDTVGGETQERSWEVLKPGGVQASLIGFAPDAVAAATARGLRAESIGTRPDGSQLEQIAKLIDAGQVRPIVSTVFPLAEARQAYDLSQQGHVSGKVVLHISNG